MEGALPKQEEFMMILVIYTGAEEMAMDSDGSGSGDGYGPSRYAAQATHVKFLFRGLRKL